MVNPDQISEFSASDSDGAYLAAIREATLRLRKLEERQAKLREEASQINKLVMETRAAIEGLYLVCSKEAQASLKQHNTATVEPQEQVEKRKTGGYGTVIDLMKRFPAKEWRASDIKNFLEQQSEEVDEKFVYNALQHFSTQGDIIRIRRGLYKIAETGFVFEGLTSQD